MGTLPLSINLRNCLKYHYFLLTHSVHPSSYLEVVWIGSSPTPSLLREPPELGIKYLLEEQQLSGGSRQAVVVSGVTQSNAVEASRSQEPGLIARGVPQ